MNLTKTNHQLTWLNRNASELTPYARSEYWEKGRGLVMVFADQIVDGKPNYGYLPADKAAGAMGSDWETSPERAAVEAYDPEKVSVVQFVWLAGRAQKCHTALFVLRATV